MWKNAQWIGIPREEIEDKRIYHGDMNGRFAYFRHSFSLEERANLKILISANSRYRLWVNGTGIQSGPCRSDRYRHFYEEIDLSENLIIGENVIAAQVLLCDHSYIRAQYSAHAPLTSVASLPSGHRLAVEGQIRNSLGEVILDITTGIADWRVYLDAAYRLEYMPFISENLGSTIEHLNMAEIPHQWKTASYDAGNWRKASAIETVAWSDFYQSVGLYADFHMKERPIPLLLEEERELIQEIGTCIFPESADSAIVESHSIQKLCFALPYIQNTFPIYLFEEGKDAEIEFTYFEKFSGKEKTVKRDDWENGEIGRNGLTDSVILDGTVVKYEPFWYRTFRFVQITIQTEEAPVILHRPRYHKTGYPLNAGSRIQSSAKWVEEIYRMCEHTLESCMMETYMDCPFWEQMQYPMDTRLQALFTYVCSKDTLLAKKALEDFHCSKIPEGLILGKAPTGYLQVISTFSLHYIYMIYDYYMRTGDKAIIKKYRGDMDEILNYYEDRIGDSGMVEQIDYWPFVDWQQAWNENGGKPAALLQGPSTIINLMYAYALKAAADLNEECGRESMAQEYRRRQKEICNKVQTKCWDDKRGMYREGPSCLQFTQHAQSWAVLNQMTNKETAKAMMEHTFTDDDVLRCYFSTCYELFRACELADCYELTKKQMDWWIDLLEEHCTTCPETPVNARSECHAWSALPMYELFRTIAGIKSCEAGSAKYVIHPHLDYVPDLKGELVAEQGMIQFSYYKSKPAEANEPGWIYEITLPQQCEAYFEKQNGDRVPLSAGSNVIRD